MLILAENALAANSGKAAFKTDSKYSAQTKKKQKLNIDFTKKNLTGGDISEMNQKIDEAESDLKIADNNNQRNQLNRNQKNSSYLFKAQPSSSVVVDPNNNHNDLELLGDASKQQKQAYFDNTTSVVKTEIKEESSAFGAGLMVSQSKEVELPESGEYSNETTLILLPSYKLSTDYTAGLKLIGVVDHSDSSKSELKSGSVNLIKSPMDMTNYLTASPGVVYLFPVNSTQRDTKSFIGALQGNVTFGTKNDALGKLNLSLVLGATKSFFEYTTELNTDPEKEDTFNSDYSLVQGIIAVYPLFSESLSFNFSLVNKQAWDYAGDRKYTYDLTETLNWNINDHFGIFGGLENEEAAIVSKEESLNYRFYNGKTATYVLGLNFSI